MTTREISDLAELSIDAQALAVDDQTSTAYLILLNEKAFYRDAIRFRAYDCATTHAAIQWAASCVHQLQSPEHASKGAESLSAVDKWLVLPNDVTRMTAKAAAQKGGITTAADCLAMAVFLSGGSISPIGAPHNPPPPYASQKMAAGSITIAVLSRSPELAAERYRQALAIV